MLMEMCMKESGPMTRLMAMENILTLMAQSMKELGKAINSVVMELRDGLTEQCIKANMQMV